MKLYFVTLGNSSHYHDYLSYYLCSCVCVCNCKGHSSEGLTGKLFMTLIFGHMWDKAWWLLDPESGYVMRGTS